MVMEKSRKYLNALSELAVDLNKATDQYMEELKAIELSLEKLNLGVAVELDRRLDETPVREEADDRPFYPARKYFTSWHLRYGKDDRGKWRLLVRQYKVAAEPESDEYIEEGDTPLLQASRDLRIAAADHIPELLKALQGAAKEKISILEKISDKQ